MDEDRLKHSLAVARKMVEIGRKNGLDNNSLYELFVLGFNHDIGYEFGSGDKHNIIGREILRDSGYKYWKEVYYHGRLQEEYSSDYLKILNQADMMIDKFGNDVGYNKRLEDILTRYGEDSRVYQECKKLIKAIK